ncbi:MAG TPA: type IV pilus twitching motility protein PilT [Phycisphaerae bacterium]|nr:type IV pilus twitching motility protein PilT [Phycisphaerae bacterium]
MSNINEILKTALDNKASDIHIVTGHVPMIRLHTQMTPTDFPVITPEAAMAILKDTLPEKRIEPFMENRDADYSYELPGLARFRVNAHFQKNTVAFAFRVITEKVRALDALNLPDVISRLTYLPRGLVLVTGDTGSGKSTTLAAMIDAMNKRYHKHIITMEDPIEYILHSNKCTIEQREVGSDVPSFSSGLKHVLRQDPDIILVGEMRDLETTSAAITAAETGHFVLSTLHTNNAAQTIERIIDIYPGEQQNQIRSMLSNTLQAVVCQTLFKRIDQPGMVPGIEILICTPAVRNLIRENRIYEIQNVIETSRALGMQTMDTSIKQLYFNGKISKEDALSMAHHPEKLERQLVA